MCKLLLDKGKANVDESSQKGCTALLYSARGGYDQIITLLLEHKADKQHQDASGSTALHHASEKNFPAVVDMLMKAGADGSVQDLAGRTPMFEAVLNSSKACVETLLNSSVDVNVIDFLGHTALFYAARDGNEDLVRLLVEKGGADTNLYSMPNQAMEKELLEKKEDKMAAAIGNCRVPIHAAVACGHGAVLEYLISKGARVAESGRHNNSSLHIAAYAGNVDAGKILVKAGLDLNARNSKNLTALDIFTRNCAECVPALMELAKAKPEQPIKVYEGEMPGEEEEDQELSVQLTDAAGAEDPRVGAVAAVYGPKVAAGMGFCFKQGSADQHAEEVPRIPLAAQELHERGTVD